MENFEFASYVLWGFVTAFGVILYAFTKPGSKEKRRWNRRKS